MFNRQSIHIALLLWGCVFSVIAAICMFMSKNFEKEKRRWMLLMQISSAILLLSDAFAWGYRGESSSTGYMMVRVSNFFVFFLSDVIMGFFHGYVCACLFEEDRKGKGDSCRCFKRLQIKYMNERRFCCGRYSYNRSAFFCEYDEGGGQRKQGQWENMFCVFLQKV